MCTTSLQQIIKITSCSTRAGARAVDLGGQSLKLSTKAAVFKRVSLLIGGRASVSIRGLGAGTVFNHGLTDTDSLD